MNQITCCFISEKQECIVTYHPIKILMAPRSIATCYHSSLYWELSTLSLASSEELGRKTPATESSMDFRLLLCQRDKFTNINGGAAATTSIGIVPSNDNHWWTVYKIWFNAKNLSMFACIKTASREELNNHVHTVWHQSCHEW